MGNLGFDPQTALLLFYTFFYCMAYIFGGAPLIVLSVYIVWCARRCSFQNLVRFSSLPAASDKT